MAHKEMSQVSTTNNTKHHQAQTLRRIAEWVDNPHTATDLLLAADQLDTEPEEPVSTHDCPVCNGTGLIAIANTISIAALMHGMPAAPEAEGCEECEGAGTIPVTGADFPGTRRDPDDKHPF